MGRVDFMTKVPPPDNNGAGCQCLHLCPRPPSGGRIMCVAHPGAQNHLSTCHFPFAFKGPFHADAWTLKLPLRKTVILPRDGLEFSLSLCHPLLKLMKMCAHVFCHAKTIPAYLNFLA